MEIKNTRVKDLINKMTIEEKLQCVHGQLGDPYRANQVGFIRGIKRLGVPDLFLADGESGVNISWETTSFPSKVSLASTFDKKSAWKYGNALGKEAKATGIHMLLTPRVNIVRDPVAAKGTSNGGNYQTYSEDPILNGIMGSEESKGIQNNNQAMANLKQMFGSSTGAAQGAGNSVIDEQTIHEVYLKPFEMVIKSGVASLMTSYNQVNGIWTYDSKEYITNYARKKWGFKGFVYNDWYCLYDPNAIRHGVTIEMPGSDYYDEGSELSVYGKQLLDAINNPSEPVTIEDLDQAVYYYLDTLDRFGILDEEQRVPRQLDNRTKKESAEVALDIARKGAVLLKNEGNLLPYSFEGKQVLIVGPGGKQQVMPTFKESPYGFSDRKTSVYDLLKEKYGNAMHFSEGINLDGVVVPESCLKPEINSNKNGLKRYVERFTYETLSNGDLSAFPIAQHYELDKNIEYVQNNALPVLKKEQLKGFFKEVPREYYMWHGYITPQETGVHRLSLQSKFPGLDKFEENQVENIDLAVSTSGNLYIRELNTNEHLTRIGLGTRLSANGTANPYSEVVQCQDGWNNAGGTVYLEKGKSYEIYFNHTNIYLEPLEIRFAWTTPSMIESARNKAVELAKKADIVLCFAYHQSVNESMRLQEAQDELIDSIYEANNNTVLILNTGDPIEMPWNDKIPAILQMWFSGQEGARATLDILEGKYNPAGRLPVTFPRKLKDIASRSIKNPERHAPSGRIANKNAIHSNVAQFTEGIFNGYRWFDAMNIEPLYPFGHGLSYSSFEYDNIELIVKNERVEVNCAIYNSGPFDGDEVVQCYLGKPEEIPLGIQVANKTLVDFERILIKSKETVKVTFIIERNRFEYFDKKTSNYKLLDGEREILIGASSRDIRLSVNFNVERLGI